MHAIVFAAGLGTRLRPLTLTRPKGLVDVGGKPMIRRVVERLRDAGIDRIVVNLHHFPEQYREYFDSTPLGVEIAFSDESDLLLDTGGAIAKAAPLLAGDSPVVVYNADILTDVDLRAMLRRYDETRPDSLLLASPRKSSRQLYFGPDDRLRGWQNLNTGELRPADFALADTDSRLAFGGIHVISQRMVTALAEEGRANPVFPIVPFYLANLDRLDIRAYTPSEPFTWFDVGRPETLEQARQYITQTERTK